MSELKKVKIHFEDFLRERKEDSFTTYEKKLINIIRDNFNDIAKLGTAHGKRAHLLVKLIDEYRDTAEDSIVLNNDIELGQKLSITKLHSLKVESFRGFRTRETFSFDRPKILVYGPNGSGKSSFCEALEYSLLGFISEAQAKRFDTKTYITNTVTENYKEPILKGVFEDGSVKKITSNPDAYYFSFIEKNRIVDFARYSAKTESKQESLLATLFGLDDFYTFVGEFTNRFEEYIPIESKKEEEYELKKNKIESHKDNKKTYKEDLKELQLKKDKVIQDSKLEMTFKELDDFINGTQDSKGKIEQIDEELQQTKPKSYDFNETSELLKNISEIEKKIEHFENCDQEYEDKKENIRFRQIFEVVQEFEQIITDKCPVCETPIKKTKINPYENARNKLEKFKEVALIEEEKERAWNNLIENAYEFVMSFEKRKEAAQDFNITIKVAISSLLKKTNVSTNISKTYLNTIKKFIDEIKTQKETLIELDEYFKENNKKVDKFSDLKQPLKNEKKTLEDLKTRIANIKAEESIYKEKLAKEESTIEKFEKENEELIKSIGKEKKKIEENKKYLQAYNSLLDKLNFYKSKLPVQLTENLGDLTKEFYNRINKDDEKFELIEEIKLPSKAGERIKMRFQDNPKKDVDAMHILSEGHTRCLGLSLLLAKVVYDNLPFIIFDDVVNAIDDDHRGRIRELLFENHHFKDNQLILTSHSEEYIKDIENKHFTLKNYDKEVRLYTLLKPVDKTINKKETTKHYINKADQYLKEHSKRDALSNCRRALEHLTKKLWKKAARSENDFRLNIPMRRPNSPPDLMNVVQSLRSKLSKLDDQKFEKCVTILSWLEGLKSKKHLEWNYLNKGTHEESDRHDFDEVIVREIFKKLRELEQEIATI